MPDHEEPNARGLFGGVFARGGVEAGDTPRLQAMLDAEAGRARALERAGLAAAHRTSIMIGRTLLQQAVPVTFGLVAAGWLTSVDEARAGLDSVGPRLAVQFGGAAGTLASLGEAGQRVATLLAEELGL